MVKPMKHRVLARLLTDAGYSRAHGKGDHEKWTNGPELVVITRTREVSPGLVRQALQSIARSKGEK
ncbi:MAG TPA: toxin HicA [Microbacterium sp.]|nr:toxin HicA [Microbacterium sp.]